MQGQPLWVGHKSLFSHSCALSNNSRLMNFWFCSRPRGELHSSLMADRAVKLPHTYGWHHLISLTVSVPEKSWSHKDAFWHWRNFKTNTIQFLSLKVSWFMKAAYIKIHKCSVIKVGLWVQSEVSSHPPQFLTCCNGSKVTWLIDKGLTTKHTYWKEVKGGCRELCRRANILCRFLK